MRQNLVILAATLVLATVSISSTALAQSSAKITLPEGGNVNLVGGGPRGALNVAAAIQMLRGAPVSTFQSPGAAYQNVNNVWGYGYGAYGSAGLLNGGGVSQNDMALAYALGQEARGYNPDLGWQMQNDAYKTAYRDAVVALAFRTGDVNGFKSAVINELDQTQAGLSRSERGRQALAAELGRARTAAAADRSRVSNEILIKDREIARLRTEIGQLQLAVDALAVPGTASSNTSPSSTTGATAPTGQRTAREVATGLIKGHNP